MIEELDIFVPEEDMEELEACFCLCGIKSGSGSGGPNALVEG